MLQRVRFNSHVLKAHLAGTYSNPGIALLASSSPLGYVFSAVAQTFLSAGSRCFPAPSSSTAWGLESPQNPQTGMSALQGRDALNRYPLGGERTQVRGGSALQTAISSLRFLRFLPLTTHTCRVRRPRQTHFATVPRAMPLARAPAAAAEAAALPNA